MLLTYIAASSAVAGGAFYVNSHHVIDDGYFLVKGGDVNIGTYPAGTQIKHQFRIWNLSAKPAIISQVQPSCSCTVASLEKHRINPLSSGDVSISVDTSREGTGHTLRGLSVYMEDGRQIQMWVGFSVTRKPTVLQEKGWQN
jgi:hypothetical protein